MVIKRILSQFNPQRKHEADIETNTADAVRKEGEFLLDSDNSKFELRLLENEVALFVLSFAGLLVNGKV